MNFIPLNGWPQLKEIPEKLEHFREVYARFAKVNRWYRSIEKTELTGNPVIFDKSLKLNALELSVDILPIQSGSGDPSPTNVRPISGRTEVNLGRGGKNLANQADFVQGSISGTGEETSISNRLRSPYIAVVPSEVISGATNSELLLFEVHEYDANKTWLRYKTVNKVADTITLDDDTYYIRLLIRKSDNATIIPSELTALMVVSGNTILPFEPYITPVTLTIALGQTVYGGTLDIKTGVLTVKTKIEDMGNLTYNYNSENNVFGTDLISDMADADTSRVQVISSVLKGLPAKDLAGIVAADDNSIAFNSVNASKFMRIKCTTYTDGTAIKTAFTGQKICYELATPTTVQLTGAELEMLKGYNYISTDADSLTVKAYTI